MLRLAVLAGFQIALASCGPAGSPEQQAEQGMITEARWRLQKDARNSETIEFRDVRIGAGNISGSKVVCGEINGQNGFGGMSGFQRFMMIDGKVPLLDTPAKGRDIFGENWVAAGC